MAKARKELRKGDTFGNWILDFRLGKGGNGDVWSVRGADSRDATVAIKVLTKSNSAAIIRFRGEVEVLRQHADVSGLLPVLDCYLPDDTTAESLAWYLMPRAKPLMKALNRDPRVIVGAVTKVARTLAILHGRGVSHRDVKPDNLLYLNDEPYVGDFGLADFPEKQEITGKGEALGPRWTIAPEMRRSPTTADGRPADVYSLAKTLWILLANDVRCFDGRYHPEDIAIALKNYLPTAKLLHELDDLLFRATANSPADRPTMDEFESVLVTWLKRGKEFEDVSLDDWCHVQQKIFPHGVPTRASWEDKKAIIAILNLLGATAAYNHTFAPDGGGLDIVGASDSFEPDCIELRFERNLNMIIVVKPKRLMFESFAGNDDWAYFRIEMDPLEAIFEATNLYYEEMVELSPGHYIERHWWDAGYFEVAGEPTQLPPAARVLSRYRQGSFLIVAKASVYNERAPYDGLHDRFTADKFRDMIEKSIRNAAGAKSGSGKL
jgi:serine/threonine protein kinase